VPISVFLSKNLIIAVILTDKCIDERNSTPLSIGIDCDFTGKYVLTAKTLPAILPAILV
jgi:hypothetical protein